jgi:hypothetical protein
MSVLGLPGVLRILPDVAPLPRPAMKHMGRQASRATASLVFQLVLIDTMTPLIVGQRNQLGQGDSQLGYTPRRERCGQLRAAVSFGSGGCPVARARHL